MSINEYSVANPGICCLDDPILDLLPILPARVLHDLRQLLLDSDLRYFEAGQCGCGASNAEQCVRENFLRSSIGAEISTRSSPLAQSSQEPSGR